MFPTTPAQLLDYHYCDERPFDVSRSHLCNLAPLEDTRKLIKTSAIKN